MNKINALRLGSSSGNPSRFYASTVLLECLLFSRICRTSDKAALRGKIRAFCERGSRVDHYTVPGVTYSNQPPQIERCSFAEWMVLFRRLLAFEFGLSCCDWASTTNDKSWRVELAWCALSAHSSTNSHCDGSTSRHLNTLWRPDCDIMHRPLDIAVHTALKLAKHVSNSSFPVCEQISVSGALLLSWITRFLQSMYYMSEHKWSRKPDLSLLHSFTISA